MIFDRRTVDLSNLLFFIDSYSYMNNDSDTCETDNESLANILIDFVKDELLKSNIRYEIVKPILIYILYYLIPFIILLMFLNFITTIIAVYIVFKYLL
jgi:flagellar biosynthesis protein FlhB